VTVQEADHLRRAQVRRRHPSHFERHRRLGALLGREIDQSLVLGLAGFCGRDGRSFKRDEIGEDKERERRDPCPRDRVVAGEWEIGRGDALMGCEGVADSRFLVCYLIL